MESTTHHTHVHRDSHCWSSWRSPIGLGFFLVTAAIAAAVALYTVFTLISGIMTLSQPAPTYSYPTTMPSDATSLPADSSSMAQ